MRVDDEPLHDIGRLVGEAAEPRLAGRQVQLRKVTAGDIAAHGKDLCALGARKIPIDPLDPLPRSVRSRPGDVVSENRIGRAQEGELGFQALKLLYGQKLLELVTDQIVRYETVTSCPGSVAIADRETRNAVSNHAFWHDGEHLGDALAVLSLSNIVMSTRHYSIRGWREPFSVSCKSATGGSSAPGDRGDSLVGVRVDSIDKDSPHH